MNNFKIVKAKLTKDLIVTNIGLVETLPDKTKKTHDNVKCDWIAHEDLVNAFAKLGAHLVILSEVPEQSQVFDVDNPVPIEGITVSSFSIAGDDEHEGFTISGTRVLSTGKVQVLNTPFYKWEDENPYMYTPEIGEVLNDVQNEVLLYYQGKQAPKRQMSMDFPDPEDLHMDEHGVKVVPSEKPEEEAKEKVKAKK